MSKAIAAAARVDAVFIRRSTQSQDDQGQRANVEAMLRATAVHVPEQYWFAGVVGRRKVRSNAQFAALMNMIEAGKIGTVYVESQDRWGTADRTELFTLLGVLRDNGTRLYDLRAKKDLTEKDLANELLAIVNSIKSEKELQDISYRSLRSRVNNFKDTGSWPTGTHPFGYGKACHDVGGRLLWVWQPVSRSRGQLFTPAPDGTLMPGPVNIPIPRKNNGSRKRKNLDGLEDTCVDAPVHRENTADRITLVPSNNPDYVRAVQTVFDLYVRVGLSRRQISARLNGGGLRFYSREWSHTLVTHVLRNPAYMGDTHFGKMRAGTIHTFDSDGLVVETGRTSGVRRRDVSERIVQAGTHPPLIDRKTWELAQAKLADEQTAARENRKAYSPRNPDYYLRQLFVCGHCGKPMGGRTEIDAKTRRRTVVYVCSSYQRGQCSGYKASCGYQRISHADAEQMLLDKIREQGLRYDATASEGARANIQERLARLGHESEETWRQWQSWVRDGVTAFAEYLEENYGIDYPALPTLRQWAFKLYRGHDIGGCSLERFAAGLTDLQTAIAAAEQTAIEQARRRLAELREEHRQITLSWSKAPDHMQDVLKAEADRLAAEIGKWEPRTVPLSDRLKSLAAAEAGRMAEQQRLLAEWPTLEAREKGEALRRLFKTVTLFWERRFHPPSARPTRPRKTDRAGRYSYRLQPDRTQWAFEATDLGSCW